MTAVTVNRLRMRRPSPAAGDARFGIEDALRTEAPVTDRLVLVRRMRLDARATTAPPWRRAEMMRAVYAQATAGARHGASSGAADANCVWFEGPAEARRLLLRRLLGGQAVDAWFWPLAVPDWRGLSPETWVAALVAEAVGRGEDRMLLMVVEAFVAAQAAPRLLAILAAAAPEATSRLEAPWEDPPAAGPLAPPDPSRSFEDRTREAAVRFGVRMVAAMAPGVRDLLRRLALQGSQAAPLLERVVEAAVLRASPALALHPGRRAAVRRAVIELLVEPPGPRLASPPAPPPAPAAEIAPNAGEPAARRPARETEIPAARLEHTTAPDAPSAETPAAPEALTLPEPAISLWRESRAAGLWLVIPSLIQLGFREWLADEDAPLEADPGRALLRHCALRHRVDPRDATLAALPEPLDGEAEPAAWLEPWRRALDGWLRRRARVSLHGLIWRRGWLSPGDERLLVRYPLAAADLRLRRRALDVDPGWVGWLGLSVRYRFSDEVLP